MVDRSPWIRPGIAAASRRDPWCRDIPQDSRADRGGGFTLIELLAVLAVIAILMGLAFGGIQAGLTAGRRSKCAANLRSMAVATLAYAGDNGGEFPWGLRAVDGYSSFAWDFAVPEGGSPQPGVLWSGYGIQSVLQCPAYRGKANWQDDPFTGYNYNVSYIGKVQGDPGRRTAPALLSHIEDPSRTALFGDGQFAGGANKFMRAPRVDRENDASGTTLRTAGTQ